MFRVLLAIPPDYDHNFPPLGTPALCGFLKSKGINASQVDLNIRYRDFLLSRIHGPSISEDLKRAYLEPLLKAFFSDNLKGRYYSRFLPRKSDKISPYLPYDNNTNSSFYFTERLLSSKDLFRYLADQRENTFLQFYLKRDILGYLERGKVSLLGISVISPSQAIAALTLGLLVKSRLPRIHVNIGGQWPSLYRKVIMRRKDLFKCFDSMIVFEGETPLYELTMALIHKKKIASPNIILKDTASYMRAARTEENMDELPCPDFDGLPLDEYDAKCVDGATLTYETSRGCYWSKCAYCVDLPLPRPSYRRKDPKLVAEDMKKLRQKYNAKFLMMGDPGMSPRQMLEVSREVIRNKSAIGWWTMARLDPGFNHRVFKAASRAGLSTVNFGFESASDLVCDIFDKGNRIKRTERIIKDCHRSGVGVGLQTMFGLPGETYVHGLETVDFLVRNREYISDVTINVYYLTPGNLVYNHPNKYGIEHDGNVALPFRFFTPFKNLCGMTKKEAHLLEELYASIMAKRSAASSDSKNAPSEQKPGPGKKSGSGRWIELRLNGESTRMELPAKEKANG